MQKLEHLLKPLQIKSVEFKHNLFYRINLKHH